MASWLHFTFLTAVNQPETPLCISMITHTHTTAKLTHTDSIQAQPPSPFTPLPNLDCPLQSPPPPPHYLTLNVHYNQLVVGPLKREVTERLRSEAIEVRHKPRVRVVLDIATLDEMFHPVQWTAFLTFEFYNVRLKKVHLEQITEIKPQL